MRRACRMAAADMLALGATAEQIQSGNGITVRLNGQLQRMRQATQHHRTCCNTITLAFLSEINSLSV